MNKEEKNAAPAAEAPARGKLFTSRNIAWFAILLALTVVLQIWGSAIRIGANTVNLSLIPVVLAAILLGPLGGAVTGFVSGAVVLVYVILGAEPLSLMMFQDHPFITVALVLVKGTAAGVAAGLIYKAFAKKHPYAGTFAAAAAAPVVNTGLYILGALLMSDTIARSGFADGMSAIYFLVVVAAGVNFLIEFAVNMDVQAGEQQIFNLLQIRPIIDNQDNRPIDWSKVDVSDALVYGQNALGIGMMGDIADIIYIKSNTFDSLSTEKIAEELLEFNNRMQDEKRSYILVGPGRWGSSDPFLGVPVKWNHISEAKVIVECGIEKFEVEPSQGTHFFQNVTSLGVGYLTINPFRGDGIFREGELDGRRAVYEGMFLRQVRFEKPLWVCIDGRSNKGIVKEEGDK